MHLTIRPKGAIYITYTLIKYVFLIGLFSLAIFMLVYDNPLNSIDIIGIFESIFLIVMLVIIVLLIFLQTREIIHYRMIIFEDKVYITANRDLFLTRQKDITINYSGIKAIQYNKVLRSDLIQRGMFFFSAIYVMKDVSQTKEFILTMWFSKNQVEYIIQQIASLAEKQNGYPIEILPAKIK